MAIVRSNNIPWRICSAATVSSSTIILHTFVGWCDVGCSVVILMHMCSVLTNGNGVCTLTTECMYKSGTQTPSCQDRYLSLIAWLAQLLSCESTAEAMALYIAAQMLKPVNTTQASDDTPGITNSCNDYRHVGRRGDCQVAAEIPRFFQ